MIACRRQYPVLVAKHVSIPGSFFQKRTNYNNSHPSLQVPGRSQSSHPILPCSVQLLHESECFLDLNSTSTSWLSPNGSGTEKNGKSWRAKAQVPRLYESSSPKYCGSHAGTQFCQFYYLISLIHTYFTSANLDTVVELGHFREAEPDSRESSLQPASYLRASGHFLILALVAFKLCSLDNLKSLIAFTKGNK